MNEFQSETNDFDLEDSVDSDSPKRIKRQDKNKSDSEYEPDELSNESELESETDDTFTEKANDSCVDDIKRKRGRPKKRKINGKEILFQTFGELTNLFLQFL